MTKPKTKPATPAAEEKPEAPAPFSIIQMPEKVEDLPEPTLGPYFVQGARQNYAYKKFHFGRALTVLPGGIPGAHDLPDKDKGFLLYDFNGGIPAELIGQAWHFFRHIWNKHHTEAMVDITWHPTKGYRLFVPKQSTSGSHVSAIRNPEHYERGSRHVGTIHSHCNFTAFHSGTDTGDADDHDGLHITIGHVDKNPPEYAVMVSVDKIRWDFKIEEVINGEIKFTTHPAWWDKFVDTSNRSHFGKKGSQPAQSKTNGSSIPGLWKPAASTPKPNVVSAAPKPVDPKPTMKTRPQTIPWLEDEDWDASDTGLGRTVNRDTKNPTQFIYESLDDLVEEVTSATATQLNGNEISELNDLAGLFDQISNDLARYGIAPHMMRWVFDIDLWAAYVPEEGQDRTVYTAEGV